MIGISHRYNSRPLVILFEVKAMHPHHKDSDLSGQLPRLTGIFARRTCHLLDLQCRGSNNEMWSAASL